MPVTMCKTSRPASAPFYRPEGMVARMPVRKMPGEFSMPTQIF